MDKERQVAISSFVVEVLLLQRTITFGSAEIQLVKEQLLKAALACENTFLSIQQASGRAEARRILKACRDEIQMAHYWLRILQEARIGDATQTQQLIEKAFSLKKYLESLADATGKQLMLTQPVAA